MTMEEWKARNAAKATATATAEAQPQQELKVEAEPEYIAPKGDGMPTAAAGGDTTSNLALILGILSIIFGLFFGGAPWIGIILATGAIIMGMLFKKKTDRAAKGKSIGGLACGITGLILSILVGLSCLALDLTAAVIKVLINWI